MKYKYLVASVLFLFFCMTAEGQAIAVNQSYTAQQLAEAVLNSQCNVQIVNATITGYNGPEGTSYGYFNLNYPTNSNWPFTAGVMLTTGYAASGVQNPDAFTLKSEGTTAWTGDADIANAVGTAPNYNATYLEFDFIPVADHIGFNFLLTSEEYYAYLGGVNRSCNSSDGVAILIKPADNSQPYQNLALVPNTNIPVATANITYRLECPYGDQNWQLMQGPGSYYYYFTYGGQTKVLKAGTNVTPGKTYHMKIGIADGLDTACDAALIIGAAIEDQIMSLGPDRLFATNNPVCSGEGYVLNALPGGLRYVWLKDNVVLPEATANYTVTEPGVYECMVTMPSGCVFTGSVTIEYTLPIPKDTVTYYQCDEGADGLSGYNIAQVGQQVLPVGLQPLGYYHSLADAQNTVNAIAITIQPQVYYNTQQNELIYARVQNAYGCQAVIPIRLAVIPENLIVFPSITECPAQGAPPGYAVFNLAQAAAGVEQSFPAGTVAQFFINKAQAELGIAPLPALYTNTAPGGNVLYVRLSNSQGCSGIGTLLLKVDEFGYELPDEALVLCPDTTLQLNAGDGYAGYVWNTTPPQYTQYITVNTPGSYVAEVTNATGCMRTKTFTVFESSPPYNVRFEIDDFHKGYNSVIVLAEGIGNYEYSIDGTSYTPQNSFTNLEPGGYTVYIKDVNGCGPSLHQDFTILDYPTYFTPNGDGLNDTWRIASMQKRAGVKVSVYDRYGMLITTFSGIAPGWDGTFKGKPLPADDYWFVVTQPGTKGIKGHFSLLR